MYSSLSLLALGLASSVAAQQPGTLVEKGDTLVSAMMVSALLMMSYSTFLTMLRNRCSSPMKKRFTFSTRPRAIVNK